MMDSTTGNRDKNKKDDAAAVVTTTERGPPPPAPLYPYPPFQVRCSLCMLLICVDVRCSILIISACSFLGSSVVIHRKTGCNTLNQLGAHMQTILIHTLLHNLLIVCSCQRHPLK
jgi:hypothetical protein